MLQYGLPFALYIQRALDNYWYKVASLWRYNDIHYIMCGLSTYPSYLYTIHEVAKYGFVAFLIQIVAFVTIETPAYAHISL